MEDTVFCGVFDGHGPFGHLVARRVRDSVPSKLLHHWEEQIVAHPKAADLNPLPEPAGVVVPTSNGHHHNNTTTQAESLNGSAAAAAGVGSVLKENNNTDGGGGGGEEAKDHPMFEAWKESHLTAYRVMDRELRSHPGIDCFCSGTTAVTVLKQVRGLH